MLQQGSASRADQLLSRLRQSTRKGQSSIANSQSTSPMTTQIVTDQEKHTLFDELLDEIAVSNQFQHPVQDEVISEQLPADYLEPTTTAVLNEPAFIAEPEIEVQVQQEELIQPDFQSQFAEPTLVWDQNTAEEKFAQQQLSAQAIPVIAQQLDIQLNPNNPGSVRGERIQVGSGLDVAAVEAASGMNAIEFEPQPEISAEVEEYMERVVRHPETIPQEIVIADGHQMATTPNIPKQPVIVLPVTPEMEKEARFKNPTYSVVWLWKWADKIMKMFPGKVVYKYVEEK